MKFIIHITFYAFAKHLTPGSVVYGVSFTEGRPEAKGYVMLSYDVGGTIHAIRMNIDPGGGDPLTAAGEVHTALQELFKLKGIVSESGFLFTAGLHEALRFYGITGPYGIKDVTQQIAKEKGKNK